jgi:hypothetical protein
MKKNFYLFNRIVKHSMLLLIVSLLAKTSFSQSLTDGLKLHYTFKELSNSKVKDQVGTNDGTLVNGAAIGSDGTHRYLDLPEVSTTARPYLDMGAETGKIISQAADISIAFFMKVPTGYKSDFTWNFSNSENIGTEANGHMFFDCVHQKTAITPTHHGNEAGNKIEIGSSVPTDVWFHYAFTLNAYNGKYYVNAVELGNATFATQPKDLGATKFNWIGRCSYDGGGAVAGQYNVNPAQIADFRVYNRALSADEVAKLASGPTSSQSFSKSKMSIVFNNMSHNLTIQNGEGAMLNIINMNGQVVSSTRIQGKHQVIGIQSLKPGVYFVKADNKGEIVNLKFITR